MTTQMRFIRFDGWTLDPRSGELTRGDQCVRLQGQPLQLLQALLDRAGDVITREELVERLWPRGVVDFETGLNTTVRRLRAALHDDADCPRYIETIPRRGYRFIGKLDVTDGQLDESRRTLRIGADETSTRTECLVVLHAPQQSELGVRYALTSEETTIGREHDCDVVLKSASVSRHHARIVRSLGSTYVIDEGSTNGTFLNDSTHPLREERLDSGDTLTLGDRIFAYMCGPDLDALCRDLMNALASTDSLTGLSHRTHLDAVLDAAIRDARRNSRPLSVVMTAIDHLAGLNARYGDLAVMSVLRSVAALVRRRASPHHTAGRYDDEVLSLVMPDTTLPQAASCGEALRALVESEVVSTGRRRIRVTVSVGAIAVAPPMTVVDAYQAALLSLGSAMEAGGNRVA